MSAGLDEQQKTALAAEVLADLKRLRQVGMDLVEDLHEQALERPRPSPALDYSVRFARFARAVRLTAALELYVAEDRTFAGDDDEVRAPATQPATPEQIDGRARKRAAAELAGSVLREEMGDALYFPRLKLENQVRGWAKEEREDDGRWSGAGLSDMMAKICVLFDLPLDPAVWTAERYEARARSPAVNIPEQFTKAGPDDAVGSPPPVLHREAGEGDPGGVEGAGPHGSDPSRHPPAGAVQDPAPPAEPPPSAELPRRRSFAGSGSWM